MIWIVTPAVERSSAACRSVAVLPVFDDLDAPLADQVDEVLATGFGADGFSWMAG